MRREIELHPPFSDAWSRERAFAEVGKLSGELFREVKNRRTFRIEFAGVGFFVKHHLGVGWREIFKNLTQFKLPVLGAANERRAIAELTAAGVPTMSVAAYGRRRSWNPAREESFLITEEIADAVNLEEFSKPWAASPPAFPLRLAVIRALADSASAMHRAGINHRDCYLCHYLIPAATPRDAESVTLRVIDLHRAQLRRRVPRRYRVKDLAGLMFSAFDSGLTRRDALRFLRRYCRRPLREEFAANRSFWRAVENAARRLYFKEYRRKAPRLFSGL